MRRLALLWLNIRGIAAAEFAVIAPVMIMLLLGVYDFGNTIQQQLALQTAVYAGAMYGLQNPSNPTGVENAVTAALPSGWTLSSGPTVTCSCAGTAATCSSLPTSCTPGLLTVTATLPFHTIGSMFASLIPNNTTTYVVRFQ